MLEQVTQAIRGGQYTAPKTILGFFGAVYLIFCSLCLGAIVALASTGTLIWLIPIILLVAACGTVAILVSVLRSAEKDPTPLVLGEMTGGDYIAHRKLVMGDSAGGERLELPRNPPVAPPEAPAETEEKKSSSASEES